MNDRQIVITQFDLDRLRSLIADTEVSRARQDLGGLVRELDRARVVTPEDVPADIITMNSRFVLVDAQTDERMEVSLVFPADADASTGAISVLAPVGTAVIGYGAGDTVEWPTPAGMRRLRIERVLYQPEAAGHMDL